MNFKKIDNFYLEVSDNICSLRIEVDGRWINADPCQNYLIGYKVNNNCGEYIAITQEETIKIKGDSIGAIPMYKFKFDQISVISSSLSYALEISNKPINVDFENLIKYFSLGYTYLGEDTHFKDILLWQEPYQEIKIKKGNIERNFKLDKKKLSSIEENPYKILIKSVESKLSSADISKSVLLLSGGNDSLICALAIKSLGITIDTATFGAENTHDLIEAKRRSEKIFSGSNHHELKVDNYSINHKIIENHVYNQNGFGTISNINYSLFLAKLKDLGYENIIFGDYFEIMRKRLNEEILLKDYFTPAQVVDEYFSFKSSFQTIQQNLVNDINDYYLEDSFDKFYLFDRTIKGCSWKNNLCRSFSLNKITLAFDRTFIYSAITKYRNHGKFHNEILNQLCKKCGFEFEEFVNFDNSLKHQPVSPSEIIYQNSEFFLSFMQEICSEEIRKGFNINKIINKITKRQLGGKDHWFILRLLNLLCYLRINSS